MPTIKHARMRLRLARNFLRSNETIIRWSEGEPLHVYFCTTDSYSGVRRMRNSGASGR